MRSAPPNPAATQARAALRAYQAPLLVNPPQAARLVPLWNMDAPIRVHVECNDWGVSLWTDDPASVNIDGEILTRME